LHKPSKQSPDTFTYLNGPASKALDGDTSDNVHRSMCAHTDRGTQPNPAWWTVDLNLTGIKIYNRNKHGQQKMSTIAFVNKLSLTTNINVRYVSALLLIV